MRAAVAPGPEIGRWRRDRRCGGVTALPKSRAPRHCNPMTDVVFVRAHEKVASLGGFASGRVRAISVLPARHGPWRWPSRIVAVSASCLVPRWSRPRQLHRPPCARRKRACLAVSRRPTLWPRSDALGRHAAASPVCSRSRQPRVRHAASEGADAWPLRGEPARRSSDRCRIHTTRRSIASFANGSAMASLLGDTSRHSATRWRYGRVGREWRPVAR
jgi:hypothetical protein